MADYPFWQNIDGQWKQLKRWVLHKVHGTPSGAQEGAVWYNTDNDRVSYLATAGSKSVANLDDLVDLDAHRIVEDVYYQESATKGDPLYVTAGSQPGQIMVARAKSNSDSTMLASYIAMQDTQGGVTAKAIAFGPLDMMGTGSYSVRQKLYVGLTGGLTGTKPYERAQVVAEVDRVGSNDGILFVTLAKVYDDKVSSSGVISSPPTVTRNELAGTVTVGTCRCRLYDNPDYQGFPLAYDIPQATLTLTDRGDEWIVVEYNGGSPRYILVDAWNFLDYNLSDRVAISNVLRLGNTIHGSDQGMTGNGLIERQALRLGQTNRYSRVGGTGLSLSVSSIPAVRTVKISGACVWDVLTQQPIFDFDSSVDVFYAVVKNAGVWTYTPVTQWDNLHYNNENGLEVMGNSKWGVLWIYRSMGNDKEAWMVYGTQQHNSQANANEDVPRQDVERILQSHAQLVGRIVFEQGVDVGTVTSAFSTVFGTGSATNHNNLGGLQGGTANEYYHDTLQQHNWKVNAGSANGYALLDSNGLLPIEKIPASLLGSVRYQGTWNASTNTPTLVNPPNATTKGYYYVVSANGTQFSQAWNIGDWIISNGTAWEKIDNTDAVGSVFGRRGAVVATAGDYTATQITNSPAGNIAAVTVQAAINELDSEKAAKATTLAGYGITDASPLNTTLADNAASSNLPTTASETIVSKIQQIRDYLKYLLSQVSGKQQKVYEATTATAIGTLAKTITVSGWTPAIGDLLMLTLTYGNNVEAVTLAVNGGTAYPLILNGASTNTTTFNLVAGAKAMLYFDGAFWQVMGSQRTSVSDTIQQLHYGYNIKSDEEITRWKICAQKSNGAMAALTIGDDEQTGNVPNTAKFRIGGAFAWYTGGETLPSGTQSTSFYEAINRNGADYTFNSTARTAYSFAWLKAINNGDGTWTLHSDLIVQTLPTSDDGFLYILLGFYDSSYVNFRLITSHPIYQYKNGAVRLYSEYAANAGNAATATRLETPRTIALAGDVTGSINFNGANNVTIATSVVDDSHSHTAATFDINGYPSAVGAAPSLATFYVSQTDFTRAGSGNYKYIDHLYEVCLLANDNASAMGRALVSVRFSSESGDESVAVRLVGGEQHIANVLTYKVTTYTDIVRVDIGAYFDTGNYFSSRVIHSSEKAGWTFAVFSSWVYLNGSTQIPYSRCAVDAELWDGKRCVVTTYAAKGSESDTLYFCT